MIWKNMSIFLYQLRNNVIIIKQLRTNLNLLIVLDLSHFHYQNLLISHLKFLIVQNVNHLQKKLKIQKQQINLQIKECKEEWKRPLNRLIENFPSTYKFCEGNLNRFFVLPEGKGVAPYEYMDNWERFNETLLPTKKAFYNELNLEDITDKDYTRSKKGWEVSGIRNLDEYHDLYVQTDTLLLADIFENFRNMCLNIYELDPVYFVSAPGLAWQASLKKTGVKLELLNRL